MNAPLASGLGTRRAAARAVLESERFVGQLGALAQELHQPLARITADAEKGLADMVSIQSRAYGYLFDRVLGPLHTNAWTIDADEAAVARLAALNQGNALVFLPTHRSYADPFILTRVLQNGGLPRNHILGGNNVDFFPLGTIIKRSGGVLIRRSFKDDEVYKLLVREYLGHLVQAGANLEWYMEGGRSRTGKLRPPRYGLLSYLVQALESGGAEDMLLIPVSITYDQLHEILSMAEEEAGVRGKAPEGLAWLARYARMQQRWIGTAYVRFGEPLSLKRALAASDREAGGTLVVQKIAFEVFQRINRITPVTAPALATLALLAARGRALTLAEVTDLTRPLLAYAEARALPTQAVAALRDEDGVYRVLASLADAGVVSRYEDGTEPVFQIRPRRHTVAAFYRNSAIHWFVNRAILETVLLAVADDGPDSLEIGWQGAFALRDLLKFEFFFSDKAAFEEEMRQESRILAADFNARVATRADRRKLLTGAPFLVAHRVLPQFLEAYWLLADRLAAWPRGAPVERAALLDQCLKVGYQYVLQGRLHNPESVSRELFGNAWLLASNRGLLAADAADGRGALAAELARAVSAVAAIGALDTGAGDDRRRAINPEPEGG